MKDHLAESHRRYIIIIAVIILFSSGTIITLNYYSIKILSSIRAYVNGESQYSKGQKDAARYLTDFIQTGEKSSYLLFKKELAVPIGDSLARVSLQHNHPYAETMRGFLQGRNHPDDIDNLIWLFRHFQKFPYFKDAIHKWTDADRDIGKLDRIGAFINNIKSHSPDARTKEALKSSVNTINRRLTANQQEFSNILGEASRVITKTLLFTNIFFVLLILTSAGLYARNILRELVESKKQIIAQSKAKDEFLSIASHELKTPLTSMRASLQILERMAKKLPDANQLHPFIVNSSKHTSRLTELVKDLLDVTKIQNGKLVFSKKHFPLNELVKEVIFEKNQLSSNRFVLENLAEGYVNADPNRIYQVLENLLSNAAKYSEESKEIKICSLVKDGNIRICVKDSGAGIMKDRLPYVFDRFYRIEETQHTVQGLGLGLYICKEIIENHDGKIGAESQPGEGSVFWFSLPLAS